MPNISFSKSALQEFRFCHDPYVYQGYPSVVLGRKVKYLNEFLDTKLSEKTNFKTSEGVPAKKNTSSKQDMEYGNYIPRCTLFIIFPRREINVQGIAVFISSRKNSETRITTFQNSFVTFE